MNKLFRVVIFSVSILTLGACNNSDNNKGEGAEKKYVASNTIELTNQEKQMNSTERLNDLFNAIKKDTIIANTSEEFEYQFAIENESNEKNTTMKQIEKNKETIFENLDNKLGLKNYYTNLALKNIKEDFEKMDLHQAFQYPLEFFFLAQYTSAYWGEVKTEDNGFVNTYINRNTIVFDGQSWKVARVDSEGENVAKLEITNDNIHIANSRYANSYTFDSTLLKNSIENNDNDKLAQSLQLNNHKYLNYSITFANPAINTLQLTNFGNNPALIVTLNKEDSVWKINDVDYGY
ncbi:hypothetical protein EFL14_RS14055 [Enterococcus hirae]|uniref:hypothetical protein n=1 Tax=Enterococcus sp. C63 TaxID=3231324 RepID=UPI001A0CBF6E|nr:hypothetical protein [Enterococcus hirae]EMF0450000.1 hypothetical protein [Enterococcus hirae]EMF0519698.1 hypothetical protein [Enterococcus hirae]